MSEVKRLEDAVNDFASNLITMLRQDPDEFKEPIQVFLKQFQDQKTNAAIISSLKIFGKYTGVAQSSTKNSKSLRMKARKGVMIKVQPIAVSRRSSALGGRRALHTGRKRTAQEKSSKEGSVHILPKKRPRRAPHNISQCIRNNENIGKNHSAK